jgi:hypothetical protein
MQSSLKLHNTKYEETENKQQCTLKCSTAGTRSMDYIWSKFRKDKCIVENHKYYVKTKKSFIEIIKHIMSLRNPWKDD